MPDKTFRVDFVTPQKMIYSEQVLSVTAPGVMGSFQVLYNHAPLLAAIAVGEVKVRDKEGKELYFATSGGSLEVRANKLVMLAETLEPATKIDLERAKRAQKRAEQRLADKKADIDIRRARVALMRAVNRLHVASRIG
ncbi:MAG: F0F1 ATP synthase subunit epsilon [Bacteroidota bacterium]